MAGIKDLTLGINTLEAVLLRSAEQREAKNGKSYVLITVSENLNEEKVYVWDTTAQQFLQAFPVNSVLTIRVEGKSFNNNVTYSLKEIKVNPAVRAESLIRTAPGDPLAKMAFLKETISRMTRDSTLQKITGYIVNTYEKDLLRWPGAQITHHACIGGLLHHICSMLFTADKFIGMYGLNSDLLKAGLILHDIGKLHELSIEALDDFRFTTDGMMFGHASAFANIYTLYFLRSFFCTLLLTLKRTISRDFCDVPCRSVCSAAYPRTCALVNCASVSMPPALSNLSFRSLIMLFPITFESACCQCACGRSLRRCAYVFPPHLPSLRPSAPDSAPHSMH